MKNIAIKEISFISLIKLYARLDLSFWILVGLFIFVYSLFDHTVYDKIGIKSSGTIGALIMFGASVIAMPILNYIGALIKAAIGCILYKVLFMSRAELLVDEKE